MGGTKALNEICLGRRGELAQSSSGTPCHLPQGRIEKPIQATEGLNTSASGMSPLPAQSFFFGVLFGEIYKFRLNAIRVNYISNNSNSKLKNSYKWQKAQKHY